MYDIIGDIHGHADELVQLLEKMGYTDQSGVFCHPTRQVVFCGDFLDRGPRIRDVLAIARAMVENQTALAVMGNHELNALAFHTPHPQQPDRFLRSHCERNVAQHQETLRQLTSTELVDGLEWIRTLPMWLDLGGLRVVHACWSPQDFMVIDEGLRQFGSVTTDFLQAATTEGDPLFDSVERILKGPDVRLPNGHSMKDKEGFARRHVRIQWFANPAGISLGTFAFPPQSDLEWTHEPVPLLAVDTIYHPDAPPVFFGHYWLRADIPQPLASNVACLDYSIARGGQLCAYRWDGEKQLHPGHFVTVPAQQ
ncbi:MAG: metallophosphoesterase [Planctomycetaceae bacterium]|nr:metallophosphoesterase [Planctomycetaceae bacterium]